MNMIDRKFVLLFANRVEKMRKLQAESYKAKANGYHNIALSKWNDSIHFCKLVDEMLPAIKSMVNASDQETLPLL